jgi:hypothetical protein
VDKIDKIFLPISINRLETIVSFHLKQILFCTMEIFGLRKIWRLIATAENASVVELLVQCFFLVAKPSQNQLSHRRNSDSDSCGILFYARSGTVVKIPKSVALAPRSGSGLIFLGLGRDWASYFGLGLEKFTK